MRRRANAPEIVLRHATSVTLDADPRRPMIDSIENWTAYADEAGHEGFHEALGLVLAGRGPQRAVCTGSLVGTIADLGVIEMEAA